MSDIWPVDLTFPSDVLVISGLWCRLADGRYRTLIQRHELELVLALAGSIPATVQEHLAAARQPPALAVSATGMEIDR